jgi:Tol biopolymer transport system component
VPDKNKIEIRIANADGSAEHLLAAVPALGAFISGCSWSPDGKTILAPALGPNFRWVTWAINVADGSSREFSSGDEGMGRPVWLPDGRAVVQTIQTQPLDLGQLFVLSDEGKTRRRFTNDLTDYTPVLDITADGKMLTAIARSRESHIFVVPGGKTEQAKQITFGETPDVDVAAGPNGKLLVQSNAADIELMNADGSGRTAPIANVRDYATPSHCGDRYLLLEAHGEGKNHLIRTDPDGSNPVALAENVLFATCSLDGKWAVYAADSGHSLVRLPIEGGTPQVIASAPLGITGEISRDGKWVLIVAQEMDADSNPIQKISVIPAEGGAAVHVFPAPLGVSKAEWSPDGKAIQFVLTKKGAGNIWEQPLAGGDVRQMTNFTSGQIFGFNWTDDGKDLLLARGQVHSDVVLISNFR